MPTKKTEAKGKADKRSDPVQIVWFRNDLRLADNASLREASEAGGKLLPVFILDRGAGGSWALGGAALWWLHHSLASLAEALKQAGAELVLREGDAAEILPKLASETGAAAIHTGIAHEPHARKIADEVESKLPEGCRLERHRVATLLGLDRVETKSGGRYSIYTPFRNAFRELDTPDEPRPAPKRLDGLAGIASDKLDDWKLLPTKPDWAGGMREHWTPGEDGAEKRLKSFVKDHLDAYDAERDNPANEDGTSSLSPHLHWGELSPNQAWHAVADESGSGRQRFEDELIWHEFAAYNLWNEPTLPDREGLEHYGKLPWRSDKKALTAWQKGATGIPIVDAGLRQLWHIGWMHNRVRMIAASWLIKHLLIDWRDGEKWFWDTLVDADLATNAMSWQWVAGTGTENQPFFRIFNPLTQSKKFDPKGGYIRRWVPEIANLPDRHLHAPWLAPDDVLQEAKVDLGKTYPKPAIDLDAGRDRALKAFRTHVKGKSAK